jgi:TPR repeat protein
MSGPDSGQPRPPRFLRRLLRMVWLTVLALSATALFVAVWGLRTAPGLGEHLLARRDYPSARAAFERAARGGSARALWWLGRMAEEGLGATPDPDKALDFYLRAAHRNNLQAQRRVAELLSAPRDAVPGSPTPADLAQAARWYATAGHRGDNEARYRMGLCLRDGRGVAQDLDAALGWFTRAATRGHVRAMSEAASIHLALAGRDRDHLWRARDWLLRAAEAGDMEAMYRLGELHRDGTLADETGKKAWEWFTRAAEAGYPPAQYLMARCLDAGRRRAGLSPGGGPRVPPGRRTGPCGLPAAAGGHVFQGPGGLPGPARGQALAGCRRRGRGPGPGRVVPALRRRRTRGPGPVQGRPVVPAGRRGRRRLLALPLRAASGPGPGRAPGRTGQRQVAGGAADRAWPRPSTPCRSCTSAAGG